MRGGESRSGLIIQLLPDATSGPATILRPIMDKKAASYLGGLATGQKLAKEGKARKELYDLFPNFCKFCQKLILRRPDERLRETRKKIFCNSSRAASFNGHLRIRIKKPKPPRKPKEWLDLKCTNCGCLFSYTGLWKRKCCSEKCVHDKIAKVNINMGPERRQAHRDRRYKQLAIEEGQAKKLRSEGWEIFSPTVVCDRIGTKDGKVYFIEFKPDHNTNLRSGQQRLHDVVPDQYIVISHPKDFVWSENIGSVA